jgi:hypothetical protein
MIYNRAMTYIYIGSRTQLFESDTIKSFLNKRNIKSYSDSICSEKIGQSSFYGFGFLLDFLLS